MTTTQSYAAAHTNSATHSAMDSPRGANADFGRILEFVEPIPGFPDERDFTLSAIDPDGVLFAMRSLRTPDLRFIVMPPEGFFPGYLPQVSEADVTSLELGPEAELQIMVIVTVSDGIGDATANLLAPIVLDPERGRAIQLILDDSDLPLRAPLLAAAS
ncbi:MAG: flagellar assembly protein FliW [Frankiales bacterium]|nr:flagellar assembly protein FliW [Frankiales bacterium]